MAKKNYEKLAKEIVGYIGGSENVNALVHCATRLRFKVKNTQNVDKKKLEQLEGVITVLDSGGQIQVVIGQHVADVYDTIFEVTDLKKENQSDAEESGEKKNLLNTFMDTISGIFAPVLGVMSGAGMLKALLILCTTFGWLKADMGTYRILYAAADGVFTFIPVFLAYTAAKKFRANEFVAVGENVNALVHCATRLRFKVKNTQNVDKKKLEQLEGVITVLDSGGQIQVVIGQHVADVYDTIFEVTDLKKENQSDAEESGEKKNLLNTFMDTISGIFAPVLGVMSGAGMLKALLILCTTFGWLKADMGTYRILYAAADGVFTFIPVFLAYTAAKKFRANEFVAVGVAAALLYPDLTAAYSAGEALTFLKIPVVLVSYTSSVIPIVISVYALSKLEKGLKKIVPTVCKTFLTPLLSLAIMVPATYLVIGPIADTVGKALASGYTGLVGLNPVIAGGLLGLIWPAAVMFGVHWGFVPIVMNNIAEYGRDTLFTITGPNNMAQAGATLGVFLKTKDKSWHRQELHLVCS